MLAVPVNAEIEPHVETDQDQFCGATLQGEIDRLKTGISAVAEDPRLVEQQLIAAPDDADLAQAWKHQASRGVVRQPQPLERRQPLPRRPPGAVAGIGDVGVGAEAPAIVDGDDADAPGSIGELALGAGGAWT